MLTGGRKTKTSEQKNQEVYMHFIKAEDSCRNKHKNSIVHENKNDGNFLTQTIHNDQLLFSFLIIYTQLP
jgi:hypothetical protein